MTAEEIEAGLTYKDAEVRRYFARLTNFEPTYQQVERGLTDRDGAVRECFAQRTDYIPNLEQVERGLTDRDVEVRLAFAQRKDIVLTEEQISRGLCDWRGGVENYFKENEFAMRTRLERQKLGLEIKPTIPNLQIKSKVMAL